MELRLVITVVVLIGGVLLGYLVYSRAYDFVAGKLRRRITTQQTVGVKGDRPQVSMHADGIEYDLTETAERLPDSVDGQARWRFHAPEHFARPPEKAYITIEVLPPRSSIEVVQKFKTQQ